MKVPSNKNPVHDKHELKSTQVHAILFGEFYMYVPKVVPKLISTIRLEFDNQSRNSLNEFHYSTGYARNYKTIP